MEGAPRKYVPPSQRRLTPSVAPVEPPAKTEERNEQSNWNAANKAKDVAPVSPPLPEDPPLASTVGCLEISSSVLMTILKHCMDLYPTLVNGQLLGSKQLRSDVAAPNNDVPKPSKMVVTASFPLPQKKDVYADVVREKSIASGGAANANLNMLWYGDRELESKVEEEYETYQERMSELLHDLRCDYFTVGFYQTINSTGGLSKEHMESLLAYQEVTGSAIMLAFHPLYLSWGELPLKAYRIDEDALKFMKEREKPSETHASNRTTPEDTNADSTGIIMKPKTASLDKDNLLKEIPIIVKNNFYDLAFIQSWLVKCPHLFTGGVVAARHLFLNQMGHNNQDLVRNHDSSFTTVNGVVTSVAIDSDGPLAVLLRGMQNSLDALEDETDRLHRYVKSQYKCMLLQKQLTERKRLEGERRRLRGEDEAMPSHDAWPHGQDREIWEELASLRKVEQPSTLHWHIIGGEIAKKSQAVQEICADGLTSCAMVQQLLK